jgi:hypothetical protein
MTEEPGVATLTAFMDDPEAAKTAAMSQCDVCRSPGSAAQPLLRCAKCKVLWYCSKDCQVRPERYPYASLRVSIWRVCVTQRTLPS